ncbi:hypothetical protein [Frankia sp. QA3]|uniref:hypothetical protein n=1 Tax=Frankia sp. QA3 TaxID=710111 RepID=UPI000269C510|nr:hypothetical protein [Frankia sp. QA3]EIV94364.1 hypothetical protein FraQA3DRAFT_4116 [Frankia sp. QA3]
MTIPDIVDTPAVAPGRRSLYDILAQEIDGELDGPYLTTSTSVETTDADPVIVFS